MLALFVIFLFAMGIVAAIGSKIFFQSILVSVNYIRSKLRKNKFKKKKLITNDSTQVEYELWDSTCRDFLERDQFTVKGRKVRKN